MSYLKGRPLQLIRHVPQQNGFVAWALLLREMEPSTRQRGLALLTQLSRVVFNNEKSITEQLPAYESLVVEYERVSQNKYPDDAKIAAILLGLPATLRTHLQMQINDSATYDELKEKITHYESVTTKWDASNSLQMPMKTSTMDESTPMEVDMVTKGKKGKGKGKKGSKGKGKFKGKQDERSTKGWKGSKGKYDSQPKGKGYKGKSDEKGKGKDPKGCYNCGKLGHMAKECWAPKKIQQVTDEAQQSAQASGSGESRTHARVPGQETQQQILVTPSDAPGMEIVDLTDGEMEDQG